MIQYRKGDLFKDAPVGDQIVLLHACNGKGSWGKGIAETFKRKFPNAFKQYEAKCKERNRTGQGFIVAEGNQRIGCLVTSYGYGKQTDAPELIINQTKSSVLQFLKQLKDGDEVHSPMINAGLFKTPWKDTEVILNQAIKDSGKNITWIVWEYSP